MNWQAPSIVRRGLTWLYWPVLALGLIVAMGWTVGAVTGPRHAFNAMGAVGSIVFTGIVAWRLWLNTRSLGAGGPIPTAGRLLRVFLPLGLLALVGLFVVAVAITMIVVWWLVTFGDVPGSDAYQAPELSYFGAIGAGVLLVGAGMCWPLIKKLVRRPLLDVNSKSEDQHD